MGRVRNVTALRNIPIEQLRRNPRQPRTQFDDGLVDRLAESIRRDGVLQPLVVRPSTDPSTRYEIVAGERRWRAAQRAQRSEVPCLVRNDLDDRATAMLALVENMQREDLGPMDVAHGIDGLRELGLDQTAIGESIGRSQSSVAHYLRLLTLPESVQVLIKDGTLTLGHAKALLAAPESMRVELANKAAKTGCSVRQLEGWAKAVGADAAKAEHKRPTEKPAWLRSEERRLAETVGAKVEVRHDKKTKAGTITIHYSSIDQYEGIAARLAPQARDAFN